MAEALIHFLNQFGYLGVTILIALENIFPPIPSEVILTFGGFMTTYTKLTLSGVIACATAGSVIGAVVLYELGYLLTNEKLNRFLYGRLGRLLHFNRDDVEYTMDWFRKKGKYTVFFCRCVPIVRSLNSRRNGKNAVGLVSCHDRRRLGHMEYCTRKSRTARRSIVDDYLRCHKYLWTYIKIDLSGSRSRLYFLSVFQKKETLKIY